MPKMSPSAAGAKETPGDAENRASPALPGAEAAWDAQIRGSKRLVDLFLSSRRKAIDGSASRTPSQDVAFL